MTGSGHENISPKTRALINELFSDPIAISRGESGELRSRIAELETEVELLKSHTWEQERAAAVKWLRKQWEDHPCVPQDEGIEAGEHWPEGWTP